MVTANISQQLAYITDYLFITWTGTSIFIIISAFGTDFDNRDFLLNSHMATNISSVTKHPAGWGESRKWRCINRWWNDKAAIITMERLLSNSEFRIRSLCCCVCFRLSFHFLFPLFLPVPPVSGLWFQVWTSRWSVLIQHTHQPVETISHCTAYFYHTRLWIPSSSWMML